VQDLRGHHSPVYWPSDTSFERLLHVEREFGATIPTDSPDTVSIHCRERFRDGGQMEEI